MFTSGLRYQSMGRMENQWRLGEQEQENHRGTCWRWQALSGCLAGDQGLQPAKMPKYYWILLACGVRSYFGKFWLTASMILNLVDRPTQLICLWIFICWVGGGDPCGAADFCVSGPCGQKKQAGSDFFEKYRCHVYIVREEAKNRTKNGQNPSKKRCFYQHFWPS